MPIVNGYHVEPGCYVDGHWGQYGPDHLADQAEGFGWTPDKPTDDPRVIRHFIDVLSDAGYHAADAVTGMWEWHSESATDIENWLNEHTQPSFGGMMFDPDKPGLIERPVQHYTWHWHDGEFFLSPICDDPDDCTDETCAHWE